MVLVAFQNPRRVLEIGQAIGRRYLPALSLASAKKRVRGGEITGVVLDAYEGGNGERAVDAIPYFVRFAPVVYVTEVVTPDVIAQALAMGACGVVYRYDPEIGRKINEALARASSDPDASGMPPPAREAMH